MLPAHATYLHCCSRAISSILLACGRIVGLSARLLWHSGGACRLSGLPWREWRGLQQAMCRSSMGCAGISARKLASDMCRGALLAATAIPTCHPTDVHMHILHFTFMCI